MAGTKAGFPCFQWADERRRPQSVYRYRLKEWSGTNCAKHPVGHLAIGS